jgi:teichuronic acid biosynthesis glycosyltransferase TuaG
MTKISIITPVFNGARFIQEAANSVLAQTCKDWEWIIINDGSTDETAALLAGFDDPRIQVIHQANAGPSAARNAGLDRARGSYVTFVDADDLLPPKALELRAAYLDAQPDVDIVNGGVCVTSQGRVLRHYHPDLEHGPLLNRLARLEEGVFFNVNYMLRRACIGDHRFIGGLSHCEDLIFFLTLAHEKALRYGAVPEIVYVYRVQPTSAMSNLDGIERGYLELIRYSNALPGLSPATRRAQVQRVRRILVRSWLRRFRPDRAAGARWKLRRVLG